MTKATIERAYVELDGLRSRLPDLREALSPGTARRWNQHDWSEKQRTRMDGLARVEREAKDTNMTRGIILGGASAAPLSTDVLDAQMKIEAGVAELAAVVCARLGLTPARATVATTIGRIIGLLDRIAADVKLAGHVADEARHLHRMARRALGDVEPVIRLDARCPHCGSVSLRAMPDRETVGCANRSCRCDDDGCQCHGDRPRGHTWLYGEWPGLADQLAAGRAVA